MRIAYYENFDKWTGLTVREVSHVTSYDSRFLIADDMAFDFGNDEGELLVAINSLLFEGYYGVIKDMHRELGVKRYPRKAIEQGIISFSRVEDDHE